MYQVNAREYDAWHFYLVINGILILGDKMAYHKLDVA